MNDIASMLAAARQSTQRPIPAAAPVIGLWLLLGVASAQAATAVCPGELGHLAAYAGSYEVDKLFNDPALVQRLQQRLGSEFAHVRDNLGVVGPISVEGCDLSVAGNQPHRGSEEEAAVSVDLRRDRVAVGVLSGRRILVYADAGASVPGQWPRSLLDWVTRMRQYTAAPRAGVRVITDPNGADARRLVHGIGPYKAPAAPVAVVVPADPPTAVQRAAVRRAAAAEFREMQQTEGKALEFSVGSADLNDDGQPDLIVHLSSMSYCGSAGCGGFALLANGQGYATRQIALPWFYEKVQILPSRHRGMHDLRFDDARGHFEWNGREYVFR